MNHAYVDASWQEQPDGRGLGGWGLVLLLPGRLPERFQGQLDSHDNNVAELRAVLEAVRVAPAGEVLTVYTDNQAVIASVARGRGPAGLTELTHDLYEEALAKGTVLHARYTPRTGRHLLTAHALANDARRGTLTAGLNLAQTDVLIDHRPALREARVTLRRRNEAGQTERVTALVQMDAASEVPPSVQALLAALNLAQPGEFLTIRRASRVAQALWHKPERALRSALHAHLVRARENAARQGVTVQFMGAD